jgi:hypothetical protein
MEPERFFPYPSDPAEKLGFIIGDIIALGILGLIVIPIFRF